MRDYLSLWYMFKTLYHKEIQLFSHLYCLALNNLKEKETSVWDCLLLIYLDLVLLINIVKCLDVVFAKLFLLNFF